MAMTTIHVLTEELIIIIQFCAELKFTITGTNWYGKQEAITTLNVAYKTLWSSMLVDTVHGQNQAPITKYFPNVQIFITRKGTIKEGLYRSLLCKQLQIV